MSANEYLALVEETTRGTDPGSGYVFLPVRGGLQPTFEAKDEARKEFRGTPTRLGDVQVRRLSSAWTHSLEANAYPGKELGLLLKHLLGKAGTRSVLETTAYSGMLYPIVEVYGDGAELASKAVGLVPNTDEESTTKAQYYGGGRIRSCSIAIKPDDDVVFTFEIAGPGPHVGSPDQTATATVTLPGAAPFLYNHASFYIGSGITRTGTGPDFTEIVPNTMTQFYPDEFNLSINNGSEDKIILDGVAGPNKTIFSGQVAVECDFMIDYRDPSTGFSSADEFKKVFTGPNTTPILIVLNNGSLAGDTSENYRMVIDLPNVNLKAEKPERSVEGARPQQSFSGTALYDATAAYPIGFFTVDQASAY